MESYCRKCKKKTPSVKDLTQVVKTANNRWRTTSICAICNSKKSTFIKIVEPEGVVEARELHRPVIKKFPKRRIVTKGIDDLWACDLVIMNAYAKENDGYKYMLNVIDTFSKYAWSEPLKTKSGIEVAKAFEKVIKKAVKSKHKAPKLLHSDKGREFENKDFKQMLKRHNIKMYHTENEEKSAIVERFNRTLNGKMKVEFEARKSFRWITILQELMKQYNEVDVHRTIGMRPKDVNKKNEQSILGLYAMYNEKVPKTKPKLKLDDRVRITVKKDTFANKYRHNWSREIFTVSKVMDTRPVTYKITDSEGEEIEGSFYERELKKTKF